MTKDVKKDLYAHLLNAEDHAMYEEKAPIKFNKVNFGGTSDRKDEASNTILKASEFNCSSFPANNLDHFFLIPLKILSGRRVMYDGAYTGASRPPICASIDGDTPNEVGKDVLGHIVSNCHRCFHATMGQGCKPRPMIYGLALFNGIDGYQRIPVFLDIPVTGVETVEQLWNALSYPVRLGEQSVKVPYQKRVIQVHKRLAQTRKAAITTWGFTVLQPDDHEKDVTSGEPIPSFVLPEWDEEIKDRFAAVQDVIQSFKAPPILDNDAPVAYLGTTANIQGSVDAVDVSLIEDTY